MGVYILYPMKGFVAKRPRVKFTVNFLVNFGRFSRGFREVFARFSRGFRFKNIFVKGSREQNKSIFACRGGPRPRRRRTGAPAARKNW